MLVYADDILLLALSKITLQQLVFERNSDSDMTEACMDARSSSLQR